VGCGWQLVVLVTAVAPGGQQEQHAADDRQQVADDRHPEAPAEVGVVRVGGAPVERLTEIVVVLGRVRDGVVRVAGRTGAERRQRTCLQQRYTHTHTHTRTCQLSVSLEALRYSTYLN